MDCANWRCTAPSGSRCPSHGVHHRNSGQRVGFHGGPVCNCILAVLLVARLPPPVVSLDAPLVVRRISCARAVGCEVFPPYALVVVSPAYAGAADADARTDSWPGYVRRAHPASARAGLLRLLLLFWRILLSASNRYAPLVGVGVAAGAIAGIPGCLCAVISFRRNGVGGTSLGGVPGDICLADVLWTNWAVLCSCLARAALVALRVGLILLALSVAPAADSLRPKARTYVALERPSEVLADLCSRYRCVARELSTWCTVFAHRDHAQWKTRAWSENSSCDEGIAESRCRHDCECQPLHATRLPDMDVCSRECRVGLEYECICRSARLADRTE